ncbi:unnamed protein product [Prorocentrum cordatum]|uniref:Uncharacterized protein n=1 Tax=Prorocentrum cordatum TaxID=2364126 RepID=A0ABN9UJD2_9DINO|nr:unnamed protein product [Polarella glacialis]
MDPEILNPIAVRCSRFRGDKEAPGGPGRQGARRVEERAGLVEGDRGRPLLVAPEEQEAGREEASTSTKQVEATKIGEKVEKLHSQLVLECVQLRSETASLKKKKWVLRTVLAKGGERESEAIGVEIEQLRRGGPRRSRRQRPRPAAMRRAPRVPHRAQALRPEPRRARLPH